MGMWLWCARAVGAHILARCTAAGGAAQVRSRQKVGKYAGLVSAEDTFSGLVFESCGLVSDDVRQLISEAGEAYAELHAESPAPHDIEQCRDQFVQDWMVRLSVVLQRGNARSSSAESH